MPNELVEVVVTLLGYYLVAGIMTIGFAMMLRGPEGARAVARWFFLRPAVRLLRWSWETFLSLVRWLTGFPRR